MAQRLTVHKDGTAIYDIVLEQDFSQLGSAVRGVVKPGRKICIITDRNVGPLYEKQVRQQLLTTCRQVDIYTISAGEEYKTLDTVKGIYEYLIHRHYDRGDFLVALGGGVIGDLCGFAAATYLRGVSFIQIPTTLLAQVDSSIGGKTGVDFDLYKNMVGAFHMPSLVYICIATLRTLTDEQFACGMGEVIKHGLIRDEQYFSWISEHVKQLLDRDLKICEEMVLVSDQIKREVVEADPMERGDRALLNFGHTIGHAVEKLMNFQLFHGQCVALGCIVACMISKQRGLLSLDDVESIRQMMKRFGLPVSLDKRDVDIEQVVQMTKSDKKMEAGTLKFVLLNKIGSAFVDQSVTDDEIRNALAGIMGENHEK